jgi:hypothetical protein
MNVVNPARISVLNVDFRKDTSKNESNLDFLFTKNAPFLQFYKISSIIAEFSFIHNVGCFIKFSFRRILFDVHLSQLKFDSKALLIGQKFRFLVTRVVRLHFGCAKIKVAASVRTGCRNSPPDCCISLSNLQR